MNLHETIYVYETISFVLFNMFVHYMSFDMRNNNKTLLNWTEDWNTSTWCRSHGVLWKGFYEIEQDGYINIVIWLILSMLWDMIHDIITGVRWVQSRDSVSVPGRIIKCTSDIQDPTLKNRNRKTTKVVSTISGSKWLVKL